MYSSLRVRSEMGCVCVVFVLTSLLLGTDGNSCSFSSTVTVDLSGKLGTPIFEQLELLGDILINISVTNIGPSDTGIVLALSDNSITQFPTFTGYIFQRIITLDLSHNDIFRISAQTFDNFSCLRNLTLSHNRLNCIPKYAFLKLEYMDTLLLRNNCLSELPSGMFGTGTEYSPLQIFGASENNISIIGDHLFHKGLVSLRLVDLSHNSLKVFEPWPYVTNAQNLKFNLQHNLISRFSNTLNWTMAAEYFLRYKVDLQYNHLKYFVLEMFSQYLDGRYPTVYDIGNMCLDLRHNPWYCDCQMYFAVKASADSFFDDRAKTFLSCDAPNQFNGFKLGYFFEHPDQLICNITERCPRGCKCQDRPHRGYIHVDCSSVGNLTSLPQTLPPGKLVLHFPNNNIVELEWRDYMENVTVVNISSNKVSKMHNSFLSQSSNLQFIDVRNNLLRTLPTDIESFQLSSIAFTGNPIKCTCDTLWLNDWFRRYSQNVSSDEFSKYLCYHGNRHYPLIDVTGVTLVCYRDIAIGVSVALGFLLVILVTLTVVCWRYKYTCKVFMYQYFRSHRFDHAPCDKGNDSTKTYDVYLSIDRENEDIRMWVKDKLLKVLEKRTRYRPAYSVYYPCRQDDIGDSIADQMVENINKSKRVLAVINESYLKNGWSIEEFDHSHRLMVETNTGRLIVLIYGDIDPSSVTQEPLKTFLTQERCLSVEDKWIWQKIRYELPHKRTSAMSSASRESLTSGVSSIHATLSESSDDKTSLVVV